MMEYDLFLLYYNRIQARDLSSRLPIWVEVILYIPVVNGQIFIFLWLFSHEKYKHKYQVKQSLQNRIFKMWS